MSLELESLWNEVGISADERIFQHELLWKQIHAVCDEKLAKERKIRDHVKTRVLEVIDEIKRISSKLGVHNPATYTQPFSDPLAPLLTSVEAVRDQLQQLELSRRSEVKTLSDSISSMFSDLRQPIELPGNNANEQDLSSHFLKKLTSLHDQLKLQIQAEFTNIITPLIQSTQHDIKNVLQLPVIPESPEFIQLSDTYSFIFHFSDSTTLTEDNIRQVVHNHPQITQLSTLITTIKLDRASELTSLGQDIKQLWKALNVPTSYQIDFSSSCATSSLSIVTLERGRAELSRLRNELTGKMSELNMTRRRLLTQLGYADVDDVDDIMMIVDDINRLRGQLDEKQSIQSVIDSRQVLQAQREELNDLRKNKNRFDGLRGSALVLAHKREHDLDKKGNSGKIQDIGMEINRLCQEYKRRYGMDMDENGNENQFNGIASQKSESARAIMQESPAHSLPTPPAISRKALSSSKIQQTASATKRVVNL